eukprot:m.87368 g.87368  ORF g.87368 m.87368 type:complete len:472 (+) comp14775_c0_seq1:50-1465(+)
MDSTTIALIVVGALGVVTIPFIVFGLCALCRCRRKHVTQESHQALLKVTAQRDDHVLMHQDEPRNMNDSVEGPIQQLLRTRARFIQAQGRASKAVAHRDRDPAVSQWDLDINSRDEHGNTLLMWATFLRHTAAIELLLHQGADPNIPCHHLQRPLHQACLHEDSLPVVELLLRHGADPNLRDEDAMTPLLMACVANAVATVTRLLNPADGADLALRSHRGMGPLLLAVSSEANAVADLLLAYPKLVDVNEQDLSGWTALHWCVATDNQQVLHLLLAQKGLKLDATNNKGETAIHLAAKEGNFYAAERVVMSEPKMNQRLLLLMSDTDAGATPFDMAKMAGFEDCAEALVRLKATVEATWLFQHGEDELIPSALKALEPDKDPSGRSDSESGDDGTAKDAATHHTNKAANGLRKKPAHQSRSEYMKQRRQLQKAEQDAAANQLQALETEEDVLRRALAAVERDKQALLSVAQ